MCRVPRVLLVAPADSHADLRRKLSSLEYEITAAVTTVAETDGITADVAVVWEASTDDVDTLHRAGRKVVTVGGDGEGADLQLAPEDLTDFKTRIWELLRAR